MLILTLIFKLTLILISRQWSVSDKALYLRDIKAAGKKAMLRSVRQQPPPGMSLILICSFISLQTLLISWGVPHSDVLYKYECKYAYKYKYTSSVPFYQDV